MATGQVSQQRPTPRATPLSQYILDGVEDLGEVIGHGSYAVVKKLQYRGLICVGKKMHDILYINATPQQREDMLTRFEGECDLLSRLHHPCIVQFMGVYFEEGTPLPVLVMECLHSTLAAAIDRYGVLPDQISYGILCDISLGLRSLHERSPAIIHRDLSANNVLLTPNMSAKISDLGVAKIFNLALAQITQLVQTKAPGTPCYMPPEALISRPRYNAKIDIYSMGVMMIHVFCGEWPFPGDAFQPDPRNPDSLVPMTEVERRSKYLRKIGNDHPLTSLMRRCLSNNSTLRPDAAQIHAQLAEVQAHLPVMAETRIEWFRQLQSSQDEVVTVRKSLGEREEQVEALKGRLEDVTLQAGVPAKSEESKLRWKKCADMPVKAVRMQAVVIISEVYSGGGSTDNNDDHYTVCRYNHAKDEWVRLADHCVFFFSLCQFQGNLVSVGGVSDNDDDATSKVYRYNKADRKWLEYLEPMPTARWSLSVLTTASAIIACGGRLSEDNELVAVATVEVYSSHTSQWHTADPLPQPCWFMSSVTISGSGFLLGGVDTNKDPIRSTFLVDMAMLIDRATTPSQHSNTTSAWKILPDTPLEGSVAATISGSLLAVGGRDDMDMVQPAVYVFIPFTNTWVKLSSGDLPAERCVSTAVQLTNNRVLVMGGCDNTDQANSTCFIGSVVI